MLQCRVVTLLSGWAGYKKTGLFLISYLNGLLVPSGACDDVGFFLYAPMMASFLNIGPLQAAFLLFTILIVVFMVIVGFSFLFFTQSFLGYAVIVIGLYRLFACVKQIADIYIVYMFVFITVPLLLVALEKKKENLFLWAAGLTGFVCAFANNMRILSALPVVLFFLIILVFNTLLKRSQKMIALGLFLVGYSIPYGHMQYVLHQRKVFLTECGAMPQKDPIQHTFWHNMYIGFGFLSNQHGITWHDGCGEAHARKVIPGVEVGSQAYEATIRDLIFNLIKTDRYFVLITLFTKLGVLLFFFLLFFIGIKFLDLLGQLLEFCRRIFR